MSESSTANTGSAAGHEGKDAGGRSGLMTSSFSYKPFRYPWAYDFWKRQQQIHWMPEEVPLGEDCKDWASQASPTRSATC